MNNKTHLKNSGLSFESLEQKQMLAGDVFAAISGTTLNVWGDTESNAVEVSQLADGTIKVTGSLDLDGIGTTVNGEGEVVFPPIAPGVPRVLTQINVATIDGDDDIRVRGLTTPGTLSLDGGVGDDLISVDKIDLAGNFTVKGREGDDTLFLTSFSIAGDLSVDTVGELAPPPVDAYSAPDETADEPFLALMGSGGDADSVEISNAQVAGSTTVTTGPDDDFVRIGASQLVGGVSVATGEGDDEVALAQIETVAGGAVSLGEGDDVMRVERLTSLTGFSIDAGAGRDRVQVNRVSTTLDFNVSGSDGVDRLFLTNVSSLNSVNVDAGSSDDNDIVRLTAVDAVLAVNVATGGGSDRVILKQVIDGGLNVSIDGGDDDAFDRVIGSDTAVALLDVAFTNFDDIL